MKIVVNNVGFFLKIIKMEANDGIFFYYLDVALDKYSPEQVHNRLIY